MSDFDLIIRGGRLIDGTGAPERIADVAVLNGKIVQTGQVNGSATEEINADGALVTPGFVDIHTHYDGQATWSERLSPSSHHGVTTVVMGNCGVGFAPVRSGDHDLLVKLMEGVEDIPGAALHEGLSWQWESFPDYLNYLDARRFDMDIAAQVPHAALRVYVMGERGANREPASAEDIAAMSDLTRDAIKAGALGFTSSRTLNHRSSTGDPTPSLTAEVEELVGIARGLKEAGRGVLEMISDFKDLDEEFKILMEMTRQSGSPMTISLAQGLSPSGWKKLLNKIDEANSNGLKVKGQVAPRGIGILLGLDTTLNPFMMHPSYRDIAKRPREEKVAILRDPEFREKLLAEAPEKRPEKTLLAKLFGDFNKIWVLGDPPNYEPAPEDSLQARADREGTSPEALALDAMLMDEGRQLLYTPFANYTDFNLDCCREMILADNTVMGLGDGGAHVGTICDASFITYLLTHWGRDRTRGERIDLPTLIRAQTRDTAETVGLLDRGIVAPGKKADINIIDFDRLCLHAPRIVNDLPAGGARLEQTTDGYIATIVNGEITYRSGKATGALPGRLIRGQQPA